MSARVAVVTAAYRHAEKRFSPAMTSLGLTALVVLLSVCWQQRWRTIPDTSWLIHVCERLLAGERLYVDVIETNPPFSVWLYMPPVWLAHLAGITPEPLVELYVYLAVFLGIGFAAFIAWRAGFGENAVLMRLLPLVVALFVIFPGNAFSQREHIGTALFLPLLAVASWRAMASGSKLGLVMTVLAGLSGSVLVLAKPHYALAVLSIALYVAWRTRQINVVFSPEYWTIGFVCLAYLASVIWLHPEFLRDILPILSETYLKIRFLGQIVFYFAVFGVLVYIAFKLKAGADGIPETSRIFLVAAASALVPLFLQAKGWPYHAYPAMAFLLTALISLSAPPRTDAGTSAETARRPNALLVVAVLAAWFPFLSSQKPDDALARDIRAAISNPSIAVVSSDIADGYPFTRAINGRWISRYNADWIGAQALYLGLAAQARNDVDEAAHYEAIADNFLAAKLNELEREKPDLLLIANNEALWTPFFLKDPRAAAFLKQYRFFKGIPPKELYMRRDVVTPAS